MKALLKLKRIKLRHFYFIKAESAHGYKRNFCYFQASAGKHSFYFWNNNNLSLHNQEFAKDNLVHLHTHSVKNKFRGLSFVLDLSRSYYMLCRLRTFSSYDVGSVSKESWLIQKTISRFSGRLWTSRVPARCDAFVQLYSLTCLRLHSNTWGFF